MAGGRIVLPGVGAFGDAAANLRRAGFEGPLLDAIAAGVPLLGICVGMQLLFDESEEMGRHAGLGVIPGRVVRPRLLQSEVATALLERGLLKVPQIGWNQLHHTGTDPLLAGVPDGAYVYFVHSYYCAPDDPVYTVATTDFGIRYASIVRRGTSGASSATRRRARRWGCGFWGILWGWWGAVDGKRRQGDTATG